MADGTDQAATTTAAAPAGVPEDDCLAGAPEEAAAGTAVGSSSLPPSLPSPAEVEEDIDIQTEGPSSTAAAKSSSLRSRKAKLKAAAAMAGKGARWYSKYGENAKAYRRPGIPKQEPVPRPKPKPKGPGYLKPRPPTEPIGRTARKQPSATTFDPAVHAQAARVGQRAWEIDLFHLFDTDGSGTLSARELKLALGLIKPRICKSLHATFAGMLDVLDADGDGEITVSEWQARLPAALRAEIRLKGEDLVGVQTGSMAQVSKSGVGRIVNGREREKEHEEWKVKMLHKTKSSHLFDAAHHIAAAGQGQTAHEIDLFNLFDIDGSGTLSKRELRKALAGVKPSIDKTLHPLFEGLVEKLDKDGDGEVDVHEWQEMLPKKLRDDIRLKGESLLSQQTESKALGAKSGVGRIVDGRERHREMVEFRAREAKAREAQHLYDASHHIVAAQQGQTAYEVDLFRLFDTDGSGTLSARELKLALAGIRPKISSSVHPMTSDLMNVLDANGDGSVDIHEWTELLPPALRAEIRLKGEDLTGVQTGSSGLRAKSGVGRIVNGREREKEHEEWKVKMLHKTKSSHLFDAAHHIAAAGQGQTAHEIDLFNLFDIDGSGTLSKRELRKALAGVKPSIDKTLHPLFEGLVEKLDKDGDGEVDVHEWQEMLPKKLRDDIRLKGESLLSQQTESKALGAKSGVGRIVDGRERHREMVEFRAREAKAREASHLFDHTHHTRAAAKGQTAYEVDLFHLFDNDGSGTLSKRELRRAMAGIKPQIDRKLHSLFTDIMQQLDTNGDGEIDIKEWTDRLPSELRAEMRRKGAALTHVQTGSTALRAKSGVGRFVNGRERDIEIVEYKEKLRKAREQSKVYDQSLHTKAAKKGQTAYEIDLFMLFDNDGNGKLNPRELRRALAGIKPKVIPRMLPCPCLSSLPSLLPRCPSLPFLPTLLPA
eukprot:SAG22_NODE_806_length_7087_cov_11.682885_4_plen_938_part_00